MVVEFYAIAPRSCWGNNSFVLFRSSNVGKCRNTKKYIIIIDQKQRSIETPKANAAEGEENFSLKRTIIPLDDMTSIASENVPAAKIISTSPKISVRMWTTVEAAYALQQLIETTTIILIASATWARKLTRSKIDCVNWTMCKTSLISEKKRTTKTARPHTTKQRWYYNDVQQSHNFFESIWTSKTRPLKCTKPVMKQRFVS